MFYFKAQDTRWLTIRGECWKWRKGMCDIAHIKGSRRKKMQDIRLKNSRQKTQKDVLEFDAVVVTQKRVGLFAAHTIRVRDIAPLIAVDDGILYIVTGHLIGETHIIAGVAVLSSLVFAASAS
jgi:hypothetical protein